MKKWFGFIYNPLTVFALVLLGAPSSAKAILYNIQFDSTSQTVSVYSGQGVSAADGELGDYWNPVLGPEINQQIYGSVAPDHLPYTPSVNISATGTGVQHINTAFKGDLASLMGNDIYTTSSGVITFKNLVPDQEYGLYVYSQSANKGLNQSVSITTTGVDNKITTQSTNALLGSNKTTNTLVQGYNYLVFNVRADSYGTLVIDYSPNTGSQYGIINALQLSSTAHAPEPASMLLLSVGGILFAINLKGKVFKKLPVS